MKELLIYLAVSVVFFLVFCGGLVYAIEYLWPIVWAGILQGTTEISQAITAGQLAH
jgi:hypothetical protein